MNDKDVNEHCLKVRNIARKLSELQCGRSELALFIALSDIEKHARAAQNRLNGIKYGSDFVPPEEQMGT